MSSETQDLDGDAEQDPVDDDAHTEETAGSQPLTITLPDESASVSDAIVTHREMLINPQEHGLATGEEIGHLSEAIEQLSGDIEEISDGHDEVRSEIADARETIARQQEQIDELRSVVASLAEILGTEAEWETVDDA